MLQQYLRADSAVKDIIQAEYLRQHNCIELIASENFVSSDVLSAQGSILTNKYAEGYPNKRYYSGCEEVDKIELLAIQRAKTLFNCSYVNVQPHSGSQANQTVFLALLKPGDTILSMSLNSGGHLTHGSAVNMSGKWFNVIHYDVNPKNHLIDYDIIEALALKYKPQLMIAGYSAYTRTLDFAEFRRIANKVGSYLLADIAHIAGLVATGLHQSPILYADVVTSTTHKTLRGPRGGLILSNNHEIEKKLDLALFPGLQGGPMMHTIAAKAVALGEALHNNFKQYIKQVVKNANVLGQTLQSRGYNILTNGTDNHMIIVDLRKQNLTGKAAADSLNNAGITCNKNMVPFDHTSPFITSGIRLGTPACTTRGFKQPEFIRVGEIIADILDGLVKEINIQALEAQINEQVLSITKEFPLYAW